MKVDRKAEGFSSNGTMALSDTASLAALLLLCTYNMRRRIHGSPFMLKFVFHTATGRISNS